jgi:hypothetical protein
MDYDMTDIDHYADTTDGQSGSALYVILSGNRYLIGNHRAGFSTPFGTWNEARTLEGLFAAFLQAYTAL